MAVRVSVTRRRDFPLGGPARRGARGFPHRRCLLPKPATPAASAPPQAHLNLELLTNSHVRYPTDLRRRQYSKAVPGSRRESSLQAPQILSPHGTSHLPAPGHWERPGRSRCVPAGPLRPAPRPTPDLEGRLPLEPGSAVESWPGFQSQPPVREAGRPGDDERTALRSSPRFKASRFRGHRCRPSPVTQAQRRRRRRAAAAAAAWRATVALQ